jgi:hypothetical protein
MTHLKTVNANLGSIRKYENLKKRLYNCNASIYFNRQCLKKHLTPNYANIKVSNTSPAHKHTHHKIPAIRIKDEIRYLYSKKQELNQLIYHLAHTWDNTWQYIYERIEEKLGKETKAKYRILDRKIDHLRKTQNKTPPRTNTFHPRLINNTNIRFSKDETALLQKGLKYNLHSKPRNWIQNLALEAETAITQLPSNERDIYRKLVADRIEKLKQQNPSDKTHPETKLIKSIRTTLVENNAMINRADKDNSLVILSTPHYENKVEDFLSDNTFLDF